MTARKVKGRTKASSPAKSVKKTIVNSPSKTKTNASPKKPVNSKVNSKPAKTAKQASKPTKTTSNSLNKKSSPSKPVVEASPRVSGRARKVLDYNAMAKGDISEKPAVNNVKPKAQTPKVNAAPILGTKIMTAAT